MDNNEFQRLVLEKFSELGSRLDAIETRQNEIYQIVTAIDHSNQVGKAELDRHEFKIAKVEGKLKKVGKILDDDEISIVIGQKDINTLITKGSCLFILRKNGGDSI